MGRLDFYKYIIKQKDGSYIIRHDNVYYGTYHDIRDALHDRDLLVEFDWDLTEVLAQNDKPNKYMDMKLPPSRKYITLTRQDHREYYMVRKTIDGKQKFFGQYKTFKEAVERRDELVAKNWKED